MILQFKKNTIYTPFLYFNLTLSNKFDVYFISEFDNEFDNEQLLPYSSN
jgi:hypothetical protein